MAILDDPEWLLKHIQHSFITSDDTGMCEMVIQDNDLMTLDGHQEQIREDKQAKLAEKTSHKGLPETFGRSTPSGSPRREPDHARTSSTPVVSPTSSGDGSPLAPSPEILSGWDFGVRRRSNTAQKLERIRKERQNRIKVQSIPWKKRQTTLTKEQISTMFGKKKLDGHSQRNREEVMSDRAEAEKTKTLHDPLKKGEKYHENQIIHYGFNAEEISADISSLNICDIPTRMSEQFPYDNGLEEADVLSHSPIKAKNMVENRKKGVSALSAMLSQSTEQYNNPFREYSKFDAQGQEGSSAVKKINIFVWPYGAERPKFSTMVSVLANGAKVQDVIGLACWQYTVENQEPRLHAKSVHRYSLHIAEDDGTVDRDFPALEPSEPFGKFGFTTLALLEKQRTHSTMNGEDTNGVKESVFVKVNDYAGFSLILVDDLSVTMGEILKKTLKRRKGQTYTGRYRLEYQDKIGVAVNEEQTLESTGVMEFYLVREHSTRNNTSLNVFEENSRLVPNKPSSPRDDEYKFPPVSSRTPSQSLGDKSFVFVPTMEYQTFKLNQLHKVRSPTPVKFGVGPNQIDVEPISRREPRPIISNLLSPRLKTLSIRVTMLAYCAIQVSKNRSASSLSASPSSSSGGNSFSASTSSFNNLDSQSSYKSSEKLVFKLYYKLSENHTDFKHLTLEGPSDEVQDAVARVEKIMMLGGNAKLQAAFEARKFGIPDTASTSSNSTISRSRKGSLFR